MKARWIIISLTLVAVVGGAIWLLSMKPKSAATISTVTDAVAQKPLTFLTGGANLVTPLGKGYLYHDKITSGLFYSDATGTKELTSNVLITPDTAPSLAISADAIYNTVINIESLANGDAVVTTTRNVFLVHSATQITKLPEYRKDILNFTSSAYDAKTNRLFLLSAFSKLVLRYNLSQPTAEPEVAYTLNLEVNRIAAGGGKVVAYYDDVPSIEPGVLAEYGKTRQLSPLVIAADSSKLLKTLTEFQPTTYAAVSGSGKYIAFKKKLSNSIAIYNLENSNSTNVIRYDTSGAAWHGDTFYIARDHAILSYDATAKGTSLVKIAAVAAPVTHILDTANQTILETNDDHAAILAPLSTTTPALTINHPTTYPKTRSVYLAVPNTH